MALVRSSEGGAGEHADGGRDERRDGLITRIHGIANPQKIAYVASLLQAN